MFEPVEFGVAARMFVIDSARADDKDALGDYIEAQVHGPVRLGHDVEALVLDPGFRGTDVEALAVALPCPVEWHHGFRLTTDDAVIPDYRGATASGLGQDAR